MLGILWELTFSASSLSRRHRADATGHGDVLHHPPRDPQSHPRNWNNQYAREDVHQNPPKDLMTLAVELKLDPGAACVAREPAIHGRGGPGPSDDAVYRDSHQQVPPQQLAIIP